jgi:hypothetical protein
LGAMVAALLPARLPSDAFSNVPWTEIVASSAVAFLLLIAISLSSYAGEVFHSELDGYAGFVRVLAGIAGGMLT